jgi:hypothetical protein
MRSSLLRTTVTLAGATLATQLQAYAPGDSAYTKRMDTALLVEPAPLAAPATKLKLGTKLKVEEVKGSWLRVSEAKNAGWIFKGNVSAAAPDKDVGLAAIPLDASATTATAAARPLAPAAAEYSTAKDLGKAREDLEWVIEQGGRTTAAEVTAYLQEKKKGEFQ